MRLEYIGTALSKKIGVLQPSSLKVVPTTPNASYREPRHGRQLLPLVVVRRDRPHKPQPRLLGARERHLGLHPIVTSQYSSTTLYQVSYHI
jgi:hypothetical protein